MADLDQIQLPSGSTYDLISKTTKGVVRATMDSSSTSTAFVATADGITSLYDGLTILLKNTVVASASGCTLDLNGLGAKTMRASLNAATITTQWALNDTYIFIYYSSADVWEMYQGYNSNTNTWRGINVNGTALLGTGTSTGALNFKNGTNCIVTGSGNDISFVTNFYGTCGNAAGTAQKAVTVSGGITFNNDLLVAGVTINVKFTYSNTHATPTLKVGSATAKDIKAYGTTKPGTTSTASWYAGNVVSFTYDGTYWVMNDYKSDTNTLAYNVEYYYYRLPAGTNGVKQNSLFLKTTDGLPCSITTNSGDGSVTKTFDTTTKFDFTNVMYYANGEDTASGTTLIDNKVWTINISANMTYTVNGVTTDASTSSLENAKPLYMVFNKPTDPTDIYKYGAYVSTLASGTGWSTIGPFTQDPLSVSDPGGYVFVFLGIMRNSYHLNLVDNNIAYMVRSDNVGNKRLVPYTINYVESAAIADSATEATNATYALYLGTPLVCDANDTASVANNTNVVVSSFNLGSKTSGKYIIIASVKYPAGSSSSNQWRYTQISTSSGATDAPISTQFLDNISMPGNNQYVAHLMGMVDTASVSNVYLKAWHNLGASVNVSYCMQIIRIGNSSS